MDTATTETKPAVDPLDSPAVALHKAAKAKTKTKASKKGGKKKAKKVAKKAKRLVKKLLKKAKKATAAKVTKRKRTGPHVTFKRAGDSLKGKLVKALKQPRTIIQLAKLMKVGKSMAQQYIVSLKAAGVKVKRDEATRQGKRGPKALTFVVG